MSAGKRATAIAYVHAELAGRQWLWVIDDCPYCGRRHTHGGGRGTGPTLLGFRVPHCWGPGVDDLPQYELVERHRPKR